MCVREREEREREKDKERQIEREGEEEGEGEGERPEVQFGSVDTERPSRSVPASPPAELSPTPDVTVEKDGDIIILPPSLSTTNPYNTTKKPYMYRHNTTWLPLKKPYSCGCGLTPSSAM